MVLDVLGRFLSARAYLRPVFVVGAGRSGTSVLKRALGRHSSIAACDGEAPAVAELALGLYEFEFGGHGSYFRESLKIPSEALRERLRRLCFEAASGSHFGLRLFAREVARSGKRPYRITRWCAKTFPTREAADCLLALYPAARFIYIVRNGPDVVRSRERFPHMRHLPFEEQCRVWAESVEKYRHFTGRPEAMRVRHEELARDPERVFADLQAFLQVRHEDAPGGFVRSTLVHPLDEQTRSDVDVRALLEDRQPGSAGWDPEQLGTFQRICGDAMRELGYEIGA